MDTLLAINPAHTAPKETERDDRLFEAAQRLETSFIAEMLKSAGLGKTRSEFGGGAGEEQFASFLVDAQAAKLTEVGGFGLAESFYEALKESKS